MLCSVVNSVAFVCINIIVLQCFIIFLPFHFSKVEAALPPGAEDEIILIEHFPGRRVHLQDFFWTGAEDAPPWLDPDQTLHFYETRTIHHTATVYVPVENNGRVGDTPDGDRQDPGCPSCIEPTPTLIDPDQDIGVLIGDDPGPRYWLLTVLKAGESVPPKVELKLARLYRAAFARQQQRHLGLLSTDPRLRRAAKRRLSLDGQKSIMGMSNNLKYSIKNSSSTDSTITEILSNGDLINETILETRMRQVKIVKNDFITKKAKNILNTDEKLNLQILDEVTSISSFTDKNSNINSTRVNSITPLVSAEFDENELNETSIASEETTTLMNSIENKNVNNPQPLRSNLGFHPDFTITESKQVNSINTTSSDIFIYDNQFNNIAINTSSGHSEEIFKPYTTDLINQTEINTTSSRLRSAGIGIVQVRMQNTTVLIDGSTRLIYSVHLGGKPVPAETAAKDMALLSPQEVALELGAPVIIQSEPYLKESRPLALSRNRDAWLLIGATGAGLILLIIIIAVLVFTVKKKRAVSAVSAPPTQSILKKDHGYTPTTSGMDNTAYTPETEGPTDSASLRQTPASISRTSLITPNTPATMDDDIQELSSDNDEDERKNNIHENWDIEGNATVRVKSRTGKTKIMKPSAIDTVESPNSIDTIVDCHEQHETLDNGCVHNLDETASPHSYLSMPSCKLFPNMRSVEPLSRILEPVVVQHMDMEFETPQMSRRDTAFSHSKSRVESLTRTRSALKDPGVVGPIVWDLRRQRAIEENAMLEKGIERQMLSSGPVGRARRRLHELLEDSFNLFTAKDGKIKESAASLSLCPSSAATLSDRVTIFSESKEKSAHTSLTGSPMNCPTIRPRTSLPHNVSEDEIPETGNTGLPSRSTWGTRPMSAGPFHRPNLPEVNVTRILTDSQLPTSDPAVPLIAAIRKELDKFTPDV